MFVLKSVHAAHIDVGLIPSSLDVDQGALHYTIPISVPDGRAGMHPELALTYSSESGHGELGIGWKISGLTVIERCPVTVAQDGFTAAISFTDNDRYCLDGQRLMPVNGESGDVGTEYRTERDSYSKILSIGGSKNNPDYWLVKTRSGRVITYGGSDDSVVVLTQGNLTWSVSEINDTTGRNPIKYTYDNDYNVLYIDEIRYQGGHVSFFYEPRPDIVKSFVLGNEIRRRSRLMDLSIYAEPEETFSWVVKYDPNAEFSILTSVRQCNEGRRACLSPIMFEVDTVEKSFGDFDLWHSRGDGTHSKSYVRGENQIGVYSDLIDMNGDGLLDRVGHRNLETDTRGLHVALNTGNGFGPFELWLPENQGPHTGNYPQGRNKGGIFSDLIDMNGDGLPDRVGHYNYITDTRGLHVALNTGSGFGPFELWLASDLGSDVPSYIRRSNKNGVISDLIDMNGDGLPDRVGHRNHVTKVKGLHVALNTGSGFGVYELWLPHGMGPHGNNYPQGSDDQGVYSDLIDMNGDGLPDRVGNFNYKTNEKGLHVALNTGNGFGAFERWQHLPMGSSEAALPENYISAHDSDGTYLDLIDMNGDGRPDRVGHYNYTTQKDGLHVALNTGNGFGPYELWYGVSEGTHAKNYPQGRNDSGVYSDLIDMNGDGRPDRVGHYHYGTNTKGLHVALNTGSGFGAFELWLSADQGVHEGSYVTGMDADGIFSALIDINGDGIPDRVGHHNYSTERTSLHAALSNITHSNIRTITDSHGNKTEVSYAPLTDRSVYLKGSDARYPIRDVQPAQQVVATVTTPNGIGGTVSVNYQYKGLQKDLHGRGLIGYESITEHYPDTKKAVITYYLQSGFPNNDNVTRVVEFYDGKVVNETINNYVFAQHYSGVHQIYLQESVQKRYELGQHTVPFTTVTTLHEQIDQYGNAGTITVTTEGGQEIFKTITQNDYENDTSNWFLGRLTETRVTYQSSQGDDQTRYSSFTYVPETGLLSSKSINYADGSPLITTTYLYNDYGQRTEVRKASPISIYADRVVTNYYSSHSRAGLIERTCNALNQCDEFSYNEKNWLLIHSGPNGRIAAQNYDVFGRKSTEYFSDGTWLTTDYYFADSGECGALTNFTHHCRVSQRTGHPPIIVQFDSLGREVRQIKTGFDGRLVLSDKQYNHLAQIARVSRDYYEDDEVFWTESEYDMLGRVVKVTEPGPNASHTERRTEYAGLTTTVMSGPDNLTKTTTVNALGNVVHVEEEGVYTDYTYSSAGERLTIQVAGNESTLISFSYDQFGRKTSVNEPDMMPWSYTYTPFGELETQLNAEHRMVRFIYDVLGRPVLSYGWGRSNQWYYYDNNAPVGSIGKLRGERGTDFFKTFLYDELGRLTRVTTQTEGKSFTADTTYDDYSRVKFIKYPGTQSIVTENIYNEYGFLSQVNGNRIQSGDQSNAQITYWQALKVDASGRVSAEVYGNGIVNDYVFNQATGLLQTIHSSVPGMDAIRHLEYEYDAYQNVVLRDDIVNDIHENYSYDRLNRLTEAQVVSAKYSSEYFNETQRVDYDVLGNIVYKSDVGQYTYLDETRPHVVRKAGSDFYNFDFNGNMVLGGKRSIFWSSLNQPLQIAGSETSVKFLYGPDRQRYKKMVYEVSETLYIGKHYKLLTKASGDTEEMFSIYAAGKLVAEHVLPSGDEEGKTYYFHKDASGNMDLVTDSLAGVVDRRSFDAWGKSRNLPWQADSVLVDHIDQTQLPSIIGEVSGRESIDEVGLMFVNGQVYDPVLARMVGINLYCQSGSSSQGYNRYSYKLNNPMKQNGQHDLILKSYSEI